MLSYLSGNSGNLLLGGLAFTFALCNDIIGDLDPVGHRFVVVIDPVQISLSLRDRFKARSKHDFAQHGHGLNGYACRTQDGQ